MAEGYDYEIIDRAYRPFDDLCLSVTLKAEGSIEKMIVASVTESLKVDPADGDYARIREIFASPSLKMASFTITEKGYNIKSADGAVFPAISRRTSPPGRTARRATSARSRRCSTPAIKAGALPVSLVSMDNCSHNGSRLFDAVTAFAAEWVEARPGGRGRSPVM